MYAQTLIQGGIGSHTRGNDIHFLGGSRSRHQLLEIGHVGLLFFRHIVDVVHVRVKRGVHAEVAQEEGQQDDCPHHPALVFQFHIANPGKEGLSLMVRTFGQMRQVKQYEEDGADEEERTEKTKVAQGHRLQRHQSQESTYGRDVAYDQWRHNLLQRTLHVGGM